MTLSSLFDIRLPTSLFLAVFEICANHKLVISGVQPTQLLSGVGEMQSMILESESVDTYIEMGESNSDEELIVEACNETSRATPFSTNVTRSVITSAGETPRGSYPCEDLLR